MDTRELLTTLARGEDSRHQFKREISPPVLGPLSVLSDFGELGSADIRAFLQLDHRHVQKSYIAPALEHGLIEMTIPDKLQSSQQRYCLTAAGRQLLQLRDGKGQQS